MGFHRGFVSFCPGVLDVRHVDFPKHTGWKLPFVVDTDSSFTRLTHKDYC